MEIRLAVIEDAELLGKLRIEMRKERETHEAPADADAFLQANIDYFRTALADGSYIGAIACADGEIAATGGICLHNHPPSYAVPNGRTACLLNMYTLPGFRGRGAAGKILAFLTEQARRKACCKIYLNASDMGKPIYQKAGFKDVANEMVFDLK